MDAFCSGAGKAHVRRLRFECCMLQTAWEDSEGLVRWRDMRCEEDPDDFDTLRDSVWKVTDFARDDAVLLLPSAAEVDWERPAQMLDVLELLLLGAMSRRLLTCVVLFAARCEFGEFELSRDVNPSYCCQIF